MITSTRQIMGMPVVIKIAGSAPGAAQKAFDYFTAVDARYSTYKPSSEISRINAGLPKSKWTSEMRQVLELCEQTKHQTNGYFDIAHNGQLDPSGLVKGWAIKNAADILLGLCLKNFYVEAGGDIQTQGVNDQGDPWRIGIRNPFDRRQVVKVVAVSGQGVATSGTYIRGQHIYNPLKPNQPPTSVASLTVVGPNIYEADRFATAAFAMGKPGISFIDSIKGLEGYMIDTNGVATLTTGFNKYVI